MKLSQLNDYLQTIATVGAIIGLLAVVYEVRQASRIAVATLDFEVADNYARVNELILSNPELKNLLYRVSAGSEIDEEEMYTLYAYTRRFANLWFAMETAYDNGALAQSTYQLAFDEIENLVGNSGPQRRLLWKKLLDTYPSSNNTEVGKAIYEALARAEQAEAR